MGCQMSIAFRAKIARELCQRWALRRPELKGWTRQSQPSVAEIGGRDLLHCWSIYFIFSWVTQVPRCCPTLVAHCFLPAMQYLLQNKINATAEIRLNCRVKLDWRPFSFSVRCSQNQIRWLSKPKRLSLLASTVSVYQFGSILAGPGTFFLGELLALPALCSSSLSSIVP